MKLLTTTDVARLVGVSEGLAKRWCNNGDLPSWRLPTSRHRRISPRELVKFLLKYGNPVCPELRRLADEGDDG